MPTNPLSGARYPDSNAAPNIPQDIQNAVFDLSSKGINLFSSTTARDTAVTSWIANGGAWRLGLYAQVGTTLYTSTSTTSTWAVVPTSYENRMMSARRETDTGSFPNNAWTSFSSGTGWIETDPWGMHSTGGQIVAVWTGWHSIKGVIWFNNNATGTRGIGFQPSAGQDIGEGAGQLVRGDYKNANSGGFDTICTFALPDTPLTAGATVDLQGFQNSGGTLQINYVSLSATYLGPNT